ncbi:MAG: type II toxin-antitoxin system HicB family antitoxin [Desulfococcaceae bacterium]
MMEKFVKIHIEKLPEGVYLATSDEIQGLIAQGRTIAETLEIARDVARKIAESQMEKHNEILLTQGEISGSFDYPLLVSI